jgi:toxin ParE1/3/4
MPYRVEVSTHAEHDLDRIYRFIQAEWSDQAADWFNALQLALQSLSEMPHRSPLVREDTSMRHLLYGSKPHVYRVIYFVNEKLSSVTILSIRHGARSAFQPKDMPAPRV